MNDHPNLPTGECQVTASDTVAALLALKAVMVWQDRPFIYTTGWASPVYVDCRKIMSHPSSRRLLMDHAADLLKSRLKDKINVIKDKFEPALDAVGFGDSLELDHGRSFMRCLVMRSRRSPSATSPSAHENRYHGSARLVT